MDWTLNQKSNYLTVNKNMKIGILVAILRDGSREVLRISPYGEALAGFRASAVDNRSAKYSALELWTKEGIEKRYQLHDLETTSLAS
jgi:hypothetical protein